MYTSTSFEESHRTSTSSSVALIFIQKFPDSSVGTKNKNIVYYETGIAAKKKLNIRSKRSVGAYVIIVLFTVLTSFYCVSGGSCQMPHGNFYIKFFDVFLTVHHSIDLFHLPHLMHNSFIH